MNTSPSNSNHHLPSYPQIPEIRTTVNKPSYAMYAQQTPYNHNQQYLLPHPRHIINGNIKYQHMLSLNNNQHTINMNVNRNRNMVATLMNNKSSSSNNFDTSSLPIPSILVNRNRQQYMVANGASDEHSTNSNSTTIHNVDSGVSNNNFLRNTMEGSSVMNVGMDEQLPATHLGVFRSLGSDIDMNSFFNNQSFTSSDAGMIGYNINNNGGGHQCENNPFANVSSYQA